ncbi:MAG: UDP-N-acetylmuramate dehydrogenase [Rhodospirillaceae bacterium]|nr:UDP-N-acetylmuramate dehydrogenase [Rhodospirillaceae bacterium]
MTAANARERLIDRLPKVRGELEEHAPLDRETWFRCGGPADVLFRPADRDDLIEFLRAKPKDVPVTVIGYGSNLLVRDGGVAGVVVRLGKRLAEIEVSGDEISAGAGAGDVAVAAAARDAGLAGLEFLSGIPGTVGGALRMNAGAYGSEMKDVVVECKALDPEGGLHKLRLDALGFSYRHCGVSEDWIFTSAVMRGRPDDKAKIAERMAEIRRQREESQPMRTRTGGSTFANPPGHKAWQLVDAAGCRGFRIGGAMVSEKHTNFLINTGGATAADIEGLGEEVRRRVKAQSGVTLEWEIRRIGRPSAGPKEARA